MSDRSAPSIKWPLATPTPGGARRSGSRRCVMSVGEGVSVPARSARAALRVGRGMPAVSARPVLQRVICCAYRQCHQRSPAADSERRCSAAAPALSGRAQVTRRGVEQSAGGVGVEGGRVWRLGRCRVGRLRRRGLGSPLRSEGRSGSGPSTTFPASVERWCRGVRSRARRRLSTWGRPTATGVVCSRVIAGHGVWPCPSQDGSWREVEVSGHRQLLLGRGISLKIGRRVASSVDGGPVTVKGVRTVALLAAEVKTYATHRNCHGEAVGVSAPGCRGVCRREPAVDRRVAGGEASLRLRCAVRAHRCGP